MISDETENQQLDRAEDAVEAPEFSDDAPGFDMLADADTENKIEDAGNSGAEIPAAQF